MNRIEYLDYTLGGELYHHGVKGMKWGVRKQRRAERRAARKAAKSQSGHSVAKARAKKIAKVAAVVAPIAIGAAVMALNPEARAAVNGVFNQVRNFVAPKPASNAPVKLDSSDDRRLAYKSSGSKKEVSPEGPDNDFEKAGGMLSKHRAEVGFARAAIENPSRYMPRASEAKRNDSGGEVNYKPNKDYKNLSLGTNDAASSRKEARRSNKVSESASRGQQRDTRSDNGRWHNHNRDVDKVQTTMNTSKNDYAYNVTNKNVGPHWYTNQKQNVRSDGTQYVSNGTFNDRRPSRNSSDQKGNSGPATLNPNSYNSGFDRDDEDTRNRRRR